MVVEAENAVEAETLLESLDVEEEEEVAESSDLPPPQMVLIKVYVALISSSQSVKKHQTRAMTILESKGIEYEMIDITGIGMEKHKTWMWENAKSKKAGQRPLTPQFFNMETYLGDYEDLDEANEIDMVEEFLKLDEDVSPEIQEMQPEFGPAEAELNKITVYVSRCGSADVRKRQISTRLWLENKGVDFEEVDISGPENEDKKHFMLKQIAACKSDGSSLHPQPPQFFNGDVYCGDYEAFDEAIENETLEEFFSGLN